MSTDSWIYWTHNWAPDVVRNCVHFILQCDTPWLVWKTCATFATNQIQIKTNCKSLAFLAFYSYCVLTPNSHWLSVVFYLLWLAVEYQDIIPFFFLFTSLLSEFHCLSIGAKPSGAVLGEVVMEGNVVVFDRANQRIGFAPSNMSHPDVGQCGKRGPGKGFYWYGSVILVGCSRLLQPVAN